MEQHAVPQDITGFKFKLVGDMTLKQFGELAFGAIIGYLFYASSWPGIFKWPLAIIFWLLGIALVFLPIEERPLDLWIINFLRAIYRPTYFLWKKGDSALVYTTAAKPKDLTPAAAPAEPAVTVWPYEPMEMEEPKTEPESPKVPEPTKAEPKPVFSVEELEKVRQQKLQEANPLLAPNITVDTLAKMRSTQAAAMEKPAAPAVQVVPKPPAAPQPTISLTQVPNVINGMITGDRGEPVEGVIVVIKDQAGNSLRALKTNKIGQFIASTPMENGKYFMEFERQYYQFDALEINLDGKVLPSMNITGKRLVN
ncbi:MAG: hypothetical protein M1484_00950 [Patescibacteria group bacterium]|nr:hypothetical protein [Patescibacteria group bacterium]MCL5431647.1 hypothetical protein [Patescibacteria group bacterium]